MDHQRFDALIRNLGEESRSRRSALVLAVGAALRGLDAGAGSAAPNAEPASCTKVDKPCRRANQCCSGICRGPRDKKTGRGHGAGTCKAGGRLPIAEPRAPDVQQRSSVPVLRHNRRHQLLR